MGLCNRDRCPDVDGQFRLLISSAPRPAMGPIEMKPANAQLQVKSASTPRVAQTKAQTLSKLQVRQVQPLRGAARPQYAQTVKPHSSTARPSGQTSKSSAHAR